MAERKKSDEATEQAAAAAAAVLIACGDCRGEGQRRVYDEAAPSNLPELGRCPSCEGSGKVSPFTAPAEEPAL